MNYSTTGLVLGIALTLAGCASQPVPRYEASYENVQKLKATAAQAMTVTPFSAKDKTVKLSRISVRGNPAVSPVGKGFDDYVKDALEQELRRAELLSPESPLKITGVIVANDISASSISVGNAWLAIDVSVSAAGSTRFQKVIRASHTWESSFVGAIAIPRAVQSYPKLVENFLRALYEDPDFVTAVKAPTAQAPVATSPEPPPGT